MSRYDVAFKLALQHADVVMRELTGTVSSRWHNVEQPQVQNTRVDLLGESESGELIHIELQSSNDPTMALRMAEYCLRVFRLFGRFPRQIVLYPGEAPMNMQAKLNGPALSFAYRLVDIRDLDGERMLESSQLGDNIVAILTRLPDVKGAMR